MKLRKAQQKDLKQIIRMLMDDALGALRENYQQSLPEVYHRAFDIINNDQNQQILVVEYNASEVIGTLQLTFIQYLTYQGGIRAQIEGVRVRGDQRGKGIGEKMIHWAIDEAKSRGAHLIQLTSDKRRTKALEFYEKLGFIASHEGFKLHF